MGIYDDMFGANGVNTLAREKREAKEAAENNLSVQVYIKGEKEYVTVPETDVFEILANKKSFVIYKDWLINIAPLNDEQAGKWIRALLEFANTGVLPEIDDKIVEAVIYPCVGQMQRDQVKYIKTSVQNKINREEKERKKNEANENSNF